MPNTEISNSTPVQAVVPHPVFFDSVAGAVVHYDPIVKANSGVPGLDGVTTGVSVFYPLQATTAQAPTYKKGGIYFDTTLNKLRVGGATAWETITSS